MSLSHALLGLLAVEPASGYALTKEFEATVGRYAWQAGHTSIYPELNRLAERGLVEVVQEGPRGSRTYAVTPQGRAELRRWLLLPREQRGRVRNEPVLRMFLLSALDPEDAREVLRRTAENTARDAARLRELRDRVPDEIDGRAGFGRFALEYGIRATDAAHDWALWASARLDRAHPAPDVEPTTHPAP
ncbi:MAG: PadR family transcriptional regulator, partial [Pseudonocardia sp.]